MICSEKKTRWENTNDSWKITQTKKQWFCFAQENWHFRGKKVTDVKLHLSIMDKLQTRTKQVCYFYIWFFWNLIDLWIHSEDGQCVVISIYKTPEDPRFRNKLLFVQCQLNLHFLEKNWGTKTFSDSFKVIQ